MAGATTPAPDRYSSPGTREADDALGRSNDGPLRQTVVLTEIGHPTKTYSDVTRPRPGCYTSRISCARDQHDRMALTIATIVCAYNESRLLPAASIPSGRRHGRPTTSWSSTMRAPTRRATVARAVPGIRVLEEPAKGWSSRAKRRASRRTPTSSRTWTPTAARRSRGSSASRRSSRGRAAPLAVTGPYRFYDWDWSGRALVRTYDLWSRPPTHAFVHHAPRRSARFSTAEISPCRATRWRASAGSIGGSSFTARTRISAGG